MEKRHFIVFYTAYDSGKEMKGNCTASFDGFVKRNEATSGISDILKIDSHKVVLTNIIEITEEDLNNWNSVEPK